jgi:hypothetical protein
MRRGPVKHFARAQRADGISAQNRTWSGFEGSSATPRQSSAHAAAIRVPHARCSAPVALLMLGELLEIRVATARERWRAPHCTPPTQGVTMPLDATRSLALVWFGPRLLLPGVERPVRRRVSAGIDAHLRDVWSRIHGQLLHALPLERATGWCSTGRSQRPRLRCHRGHPY